MHLQAFQEAIQALAIEEAQHKVRKAKAEADTAELIQVETKRCIESQLKADSILKLKDNLQS